MARPENEFPTILDLRDQLSELVEQGLGELPVQVLIVPDSTMQAIARATGGPDYDNGQPALMIELTSGNNGRLPVSLVSTDRMSAPSMPTAQTQ